jgi:hypothetical protein
VAKAKFRWLGDHAQDFPGGAVAEPGEFVSLTKEQQDHPVVHDMMASEKLIGTGDVSEEAVESAEKKAEREARKAERSEA